MNMYPDTHIQTHLHEYANIQNYEVAVTLFFLMLGCVKECVFIYIYGYGQASGVPSPPLPKGMVW